jgi:hypothetical protein
MHSTFPSAVPISEPAAETYYICSIMKSMRKNLTVYAVMPLSGSEAEALRKLDAQKKGIHDPLSLSAQRRGILDQHNLETRMFLARTGAYELGSFVPRAEAETLMARTAKKRFGTII